MYFLRRRHGRKTQSDQSRDQRRDKPPAAAQVPAMPVYAEPEQDPARPIYAEPEETEPPRPVVIKKARRSRADQAEIDDCKPAGTFRAGTLHIARIPSSGASQGKH